jgi:membrane protease YdiL (CAAX protease family)
VLLFVLGVIAILQLELLLLLPAIGSIPTEGDRLSAGLIVQSVLLLAAAVLAGRAMLRWVDHRPGDRLGFPLDRRTPLELLIGLAVGAGIVTLIVGVLALAGAYRYVAEAGSLLGWMSVAGISLAAFAIPAAAEEALFRGYMLRTLVEGAGPTAAVVVTSVLFTLVHGANPNVTLFGLLNIMIAGVLLALAVLRTGTLWLATALHLGWNWVMAGPLDLPVSGIGGYDVPGYDVAGTGPAWLTGGDFGPEGGLAGTAAALLGIALVVRLTRPGATLAGHYVNGRHDHVEDR